MVSYSSTPQPRVSEIIPFNATSGTSFTFIYNGNQTYYTSYSIYNSTGSSLLYTSPMSGMNMRTEVTIPANLSCLENGKRYGIKVTSYDRDKTASQPSEMVYFWCLSLPTFKFSNIKNDDTVSNSNLEVGITYVQNSGDDELLDYQFMIYDSTGDVLLEQTPAMYDTSSIKYTFNGLTNDKVYYVRATGSTLKGLKLDTGKCKIWISYTDSGSSYARLYCNSNNDNGIVDYQTNIVIIEAEREDYDYYNGYIDVDNDSVVYSSGFEFPSNYSLAFSHVLAGSGPLVRCTDKSTGKNYVIDLLQMENKNFRYKLTVYDSKPYVLYTDEIDKKYAGRVMLVWVTCIDNLYQMSVYDYGDINDMGLHLGNQPSWDLVDNYDLWIEGSEFDTVSIKRTDVQLKYSGTEPKDLDKYGIWVGGT